MPGTGTGCACLGHAWAVLSSVVLGPAQRARPSWKTIVRITHGLPVTRVGKGQEKNSYPCTDMSKLVGKIFSHG